MSGRRRLAGPRPSTLSPASTSIPSAGSSIGTTQPRSWSERASAVSPAFGTPRKAPLSPSSGPAMATPVISSGLLAGLDKEALLGAVVELDDLRDRSRSLSVVALVDGAEAGAFEQLRGEVPG